MINNLLEMQETQLPSLGREDSLERKWLPTPVFFPGESHGQKSLAGYSPQGCRVGHDLAAKQQKVVLFNRYTRYYSLRESTSLGEIRGGFLL